MSCLLLLSLNKTVNMPTRKVGQVFEQYLFDALEGFFASLQLSQDKALESISLLAKLSNRESYLHGLSCSPRSTRNCEVLACIVFGRRSSCEVSQNQTYDHLVEEVLVAFAETLRRGFVLSLLRHF